ncbi:hypothetical protein ECZC06_55750 [Escherichia coli]|nr:hypothetical protein ECZC06_55750 [Escherichia coli]
MLGGADNQMVNYRLISLALTTTARPARGTPGKGITRRTTKQTIIRAAVIRVRTGGKRE